MSDTTSKQFQSQVDDISHYLAELHQHTRSLRQKLSLFGTPQDSRVNHQQSNELADIGKKVAIRISKKLHKLTELCKAPENRCKKFEISKLTSDYKNQIKLFEDICQSWVEREKVTIALIRQKSIARQFNEAIINENQMYVECNIVAYDEDDMLRREQDIIHMNDQIHQVKAAYLEIDELVQEQAHIVVQIADNTDKAKEFTEIALKNVREADSKRGYLQCSKSRKFFFGTMSIAVVITLLFIFLFLKT